MDMVVPSRLQQGVLLVLAAALVATGVGGGQWFMETDYVVYGFSDKSEWTETSGYDTGEFWGLVLQTVCLPAAAVALMTFAQLFYKSPAWPSWVKATGYLVLLVVLAVCAGIANSTMTDGLVGCLWSFCQEASSSSTTDDFTAFVPTVGTLYVCVLVMFSCMAAVLLARSAADAFQCIGSGGVGVAGFASHEETQPLVAKRGAATVYPSSIKIGSMELERRRARTRMGTIWLVGTFCLFFPFFIFVSMAVGDGWEHLTVSGVQGYASSSVTQAYGTVWNITLSPDLILKLYPDVLIYWIFIYMVIVAALVARGWSPLREFFHSTFLFCPRGRRWKNGEVFLAAAFWTLLVCEGLYWYLDHGWDSTALDEKTWQERFARTMGQLANVTMGLLILPVSRNGAFETVFGVGWESMMAYHRRMARVFLGVVLVHMVFFWAVYAQSDDFWHDWPIAIPTDYHSDNWTIPLATLSTWVMAVTMFGFSLEWVRRKRFELFYYSHHFFMVVWAVMLWHAASAWYYIIASITLWIVDRAIRFSKGVSRVSVKSMTSWGGITRLSYTLESGGVGPWGGAARAMRHEAGQYAFINVPAISLLQWHPFTISSSPDDAETTHHVKDMGSETFTGKLRILATLGSGVQVNVDGPYGARLEYERYRLLVLVAGGIGITPCVSLLRHLNRLAQEGLLSDCLDGGVKLIWSTRSVEEMVVLERELQDVVGEGNNANERFSVHLHLTSGGAAGRSARTCLPFTDGRPDIPSYLSSYVPRVSGRRALVYACGSPSLVEAASRAADEAMMDFHTETFEL